MNEVEIRRNTHKYKDFLATGGFGIIMLIVWGLIKGIIYIRWIVPQLTDVSEQAFSWTATGVNLIEFTLCLFTGFFAKKSGKGDKKEKISLLILTILIIILGLAITASDIYVVVQYNEFDLISIISIIGDVLFLFFSGLILFSILKLKQLYKMQKEVKDER